MVTFATEVKTGQESSQNIHLGSLAMQNLNIFCFRVRIFMSSTIMEVSKSNFLVSKQLIEMFLKLVYCQV